MTNVLGVLFRCITILLFSAFQVYMAGRRRAGTFFSVTVPTEFRGSPQGCAVLRTYRRRIFFCTMLSEILAIASGALDSQWTMLASVIVVVVGNSLAYFLGRKMTQPYACAQSSERSASLTAGREGLPGGWINIVAPFLVLAAAGVYLWSHWDRVHDPLPVLGDLVRGAVMDLLLLALGLGILYGSRASSVRRLNLLVLVSFLWTTSVASGVLAILPLYTMPEHVLPHLFPFTVLAIAAAILTWAMRETRRLRDGSDATPDECWKLGQFYYNPQDPALLVERRFGFGYTFNLANRLSWLVLFMLAFVPVVLLSMVSLY